MKNQIITNGYDAGLSMEVKNGRCTKIVSGRRCRISASDAKAILDGWNAAAKAAPGYMDKFFPPVKPAKKYAVKNSKP